MSCWSVCLSVCYIYKFVCLQISINIFIYIINISRHDFLLKVVTKKLWKTLREKNKVKKKMRKQGKKLERKKWRKFHSSLCLTPTIFFRSHLVWKEFSGPEKKLTDFPHLHFYFVPLTIQTLEKTKKNFFPFFSLAVTQISI